MDCWLTIEVFDGADQSAAGWRRMHGERLVEAAVTNRAQQWVWHEHRWGVVLEIEFSDEESREPYRRLPAVVAALDAVPDPVSGLLVYQGRGGGSASTLPRRPQPIPLAGAGALPEPDEEQFVNLSETRDDVELSNPAVM
ncbi:MAG: hypothetical protein GEV04_01290 [Actinophytocola sp.]|nr:hypothetical protein [Actinophytocola sp.]